MRPTKRLDKVLSHMGYGSRNEIRKLVKSGAVLVDDVRIKDSAVHIDPHRQCIMVHGQELKFREFVYIVMNKPQGVVSATEDTRDRTVVDLLSEDYRHFDVFPVGRLDKDTEGLLLLTNDGKMAHQLLSPRNRVPKTYAAEVEGAVGSSDVAAFAAGVQLDDGYETLPAGLKIISTTDGAEGSLNRSEQTAPAKGFPVTKVEITIVEGKFHQVKRMFRAVGKKVLYLQRISMGPLRLPADLPLGHYRELEDQQITQLKQYLDFSANNNNAT